jgi:D-alanyl-D-alanine carboxypeptidase
MRNTVFFFAILLHLPQVSVAQSPPTVVSDSLQQILVDFVELDDIPGGIVAVHHRGQNWVWKGQQGFANVTTLQNADTTFHYRIGSISKNILAATVLHLAENNLLSLDDGIEMWLDPSITSQMPYSDQITIKHLLNHTSGLFSYTDDQPFLLELLTNPSATFTFNDIVGVSLSHPPDFIPGTNWSYNNTGYVILTDIIESAAGISYHQYATDSILTPIGMNNTYFPVSNTIPTNHMRCYADFFQTGTIDDYTDITTSWALGAGEIVSTLDDQLTYFNALLTGNVISQASYTEMRTPVAPNPTFTYGLGLAINYNTIIGHGGSYFNTSGSWYFEDLDVFVIYQFNLHKVTAFENFLFKIHTLLSNDDLSISAPDMNQTNFKLFPNPADDYLSIYTENNAGTLHFTDLTGRTTKIIMVEAGTTKIDLVDFTPGVYMVVFVDEQNNFVGQQKVVKK